MLSCVRQVVEEMKILVAYYEKETGQPANLLGIALSARRNLCIHPEVLKLTYSYKYKFMHNVYVI